MRRIGLALLATALLAAPAQGAETKYSVANGCFEVAKGAPTGPYRLKATTLAQYLLYTADGKYLTPDGPVDEASEAAEWRATEAGDAIELESLAEGPKLTLGPSATGCAEYPEVELNVAGKPLTTPFWFGEQRGFVEGHIHMMAFEFLGGSLHCGRPWHEYGAPYALVDCPDHQATNGCGAVIETGLGAGACHDPGGWPTFAGWPRHDHITHEQTYYRWLERAWMGGLRLYQNLFVENSVLCELYPLKRNSCNEMKSVRLQVRDIYELQNYIDAQSGGPGKGFFRIVTDPFQARRVIARGQLAVVLGIEVSELFNCSHFNYEPDCTKEDIDKQLDEVYDLGVRDMELVNKFDNALAGVAGDGGAAGPVVNNGNKYETNKYWDMRTCQTTEGDKEQPGVPRDLVLVKGFEAFLPPGETPVYGAQPHCNVRGLTDLGEYLVRRMMDRKMIVDPDHLSQAARDELFAVTESRNYSGLISSHSWSNDRDYPRIYRNGGVVTPSDSRADGFVEDWQRLRKERARKYFYGIGFGSDLNGFSTAAGPPEKEEHKISYPFKSFDGGVTLDKQQSGDYTFDYNEEGVSHYGLYPDWVEGLRQIGGEQIVDDMANGAEAYLQMWERAEGIPGPRCRSRSSQLRRKGVRRVELGLAANEFLLRAGQPQIRDGRVWRWCLNKRRLRKVNITAVLTPRGRSAFIATRARGHRDGKVAVGDKRRRVARYAEPVGNGLWTRDAGNGVQFVYGVRSGRVKFTGVANRAAAATPQRLLRYVRLGDLL